MHKIKVVELWKSKCETVEILMSFQWTFVLKAIAYVVTRLAFYASYPPSTFLETQPNARVSPKKALIVNLRKVKDFSPLSMGSKARL
jgi:hypothetical protein